jgi:succinyl-CoA synthetase alpha subunit
MVEEQSIGELLRQAEELAIQQEGGHLTVFRFTTGWKAMLGTPDLRGGDGSTEVNRLPVFNSLEEALSDLLRNHTRGN